MSRIRDVVWPVRTEAVYVLVNNLLAITAQAKHKLSFPGAWGDGGSSAFGAISLQRAAGQHILVTGFSSWTAVN